MSRTGPSSVRCPSTHKATWQRQTGDGGGPRPAKVSPEWPLVHPSERPEHQQEGGGLGGQSPRSTGPRRKAVKPGGGQERRGKFPTLAEEGAIGPRVLRAPPPPNNHKSELEYQQVHEDPLPKVRKWNSTHIRDKCRLENKNAAGQPLQPQTTYLSVRGHENCSRSEPEILGSLGGSAV